MSPLQLMLVLGCVLSISIGQILFKHVGLAIARSGTWYDGTVLLSGACAFALYAGATLVWIHLLRYVELSQAYPFMALSFIVVPFASAWVFGDRLSVPYFAGVILITLGVIVINRG